MALFTRESASEQNQPRRLSGEEQRTQSKHLSAERLSAVRKSEVCWECVDV